MSVETTCRQGYYHFSQGVTGGLLARTGVLARSQKAEPMDKPEGFWFSVEGSKQGWWDWCQSNGEAHWVDDSEVYRVSLVPSANLLHLSTPRDLDEFTSKYGVALGDPRLDIRFIHWAEVAAQYQGVLITPYVWARRLSLTWYYTWDCASGCVWDPTAIAGINPE